MDIKDMTMEQVEARIDAINTELDAEGADIEQLKAEVDELLARKQAIRTAAAEKRALLETIANSKDEPVAKAEPEERKEHKMENEIRNSAEYVLAFARYIQSGDDREVRALKTENGSGTIAVPEFVYDEIKAAWAEEGLMSRVRKSYLKGDLKIGFEISATGATVQTEGNQVSEQTLTLGIVELKPSMIKKWVSISNQALRIDQAEAYLRFIYRELTHHIAQKAADELVAKIIAAPQTSTTTAPQVPVYTSTQVTLGLVAQAMSKLGGAASQPVIIMNKATWGAFKAAQAAGSYGYDPFEGLPVVFNNSMTAFSAATTGVTYAIVGDLANGALANFPDGEDVSILRDPYSQADYNLTRFVGDMYVGLGVVAPDHFVKIIH